MSDYSLARERMDKVEIGGRGIRYRRVLEALRGVPREAFVHTGYGN